MGSRGGSKRPAKSIEDNDLNKKTQTKKKTRTVTEDLDSPFPNKPIEANETAAHTKSASSKRSEHPPVNRPTLLPKKCALSGGEKKCPRCHGNYFTAKDRSQHPDFQYQNV